MLLKALFILFFWVGFLNILKAVDNAGSLPIVALVFTVCKYFPLFICKVKSKEPVNL